MAKKLQNKFSFGTTILKINRWFYVGFFIAIFILMIGTAIVNFGAGPTNVNWNTLPATRPWIAYRNLGYLVWMLSSPLFLISIFVLIRRSKSIEIIKNIFSWIGLIIFLTFSYALAGIVVDLMWTVWAFHQGIIRL